MTYTFCIWYVSDWTSVFYSPVNPAVAIAIQMTAKWSGNSRSYENYAIYLFGPFIGSLLAATLFEFVYQPIVEHFEGPQEHEVISIFTQTSEGSKNTTSSGPYSEASYQPIKQRRHAISTDSSEQSSINNDRRGGDMVFSKRNIQ